MTGSFRPFEESKLPERFISSKNQGYKLMQADMSNGKVMNKSLGTLSFQGRINHQDRPRNKLSNRYLIEQFHCLFALQNHGVSSCAANGDDVYIGDSGFFLIAKINQIPPPSIRILGHFWLKFAT